MADSIEVIRAELAREGAYLLVVTGAGISLASGIPTFRGPDPDAVWSKSTTEMGTLWMFEQDPVASWRWYLPRLDMCRSVAPNPGHTALASIQTWLGGRDCRCLTLTQNIDGLHRAAGTQHLIEIHGTYDKVRCSRVGCEYGEPLGFLPSDGSGFARFREDPRLETLPCCPACDGVLRAHVLWFDETYGSHHDYGFRRFVEAVEEVTCVLIVGTSFSVGITAMVTDVAARRGLPTFVVDPNAHTPAPGTEAFTSIPEASEVFLPRLAEALGV